MTEEKWALREERDLLQGKLSEEENAYEVCRIDRIALRESRDELLAALDTIAWGASGPVEIARAAIARAKGEGS